MDEEQKELTENYDLNEEQAERAQELMEDGFNEDEAVEIAKNE